MIQTQQKTFTERRRKETHTRPPEKGNPHIVDEMKHFMADTYSLYIMTQNFHWNVCGVLFHSLHELFEKQYLELASAIDTIAERIRALGFPAPGSLREFFELSTLRDEPQSPSAEEMVHCLIEGHSVLTQKAQHIAAMSEECCDWATHNLMAERIASHDKAMWMLRSILP